MPIELVFQGLVIPPTGANETEVDEIGDIFINELSPLPVNPLNPVAVEQRLRNWLPSIDKNPALMRRLTSNLVYQAAANFPLFISTFQEMVGKLTCICEALQNQPEERLTVVSTVTDRPVNISVSDGSPGPEIYAGGWVLFHDADGNVGQRSFIFTNQQRHVSDLPNATGYTYHLKTGFTATFTP